VIVEGLQKVKPGAPAKGMPWKPTGTVAAAGAAPAGPAAANQK